MLVSIDSWERNSTTAELQQMLKDLEAMVVNPDLRMTALQVENVLTCWSLCWHELRRRRDTR